MEETIDRAAAIAELGLTVESVFVPFSQSRNKNEKHKSLNWKVTVKRDGREVLTTDYSAGVAHCPSYGRKVPNSYDRNVKRWQEDVCAFECESGFAVGKVMGYWPGGDADRRFSADKKSPIQPDPLDVLYSLTMDSSVLDHATFESWASEFGYDVDSRSAESIYRACLEIALKMRAALGDSGLAVLREIFQDY